MERLPEHMDDIFRQRLYDAAPPPPAFVWDNVERELRKRRRRFFIWFFSLALTGCGMLGIWWVTNSANQGKRSSLAHAATSSVSAQPKQLTAPTPTKDNFSVLTPAEQINTKTSSTTRGIQTKQSSKRTRNTPASAPRVSNGAPSDYNVSVRLDLPKETTPATLEAKPQKTIFEAPHADALSFNTLFPLQPNFRVIPGKTALLSDDLVRHSWPEALKSRAAKAKKPLRNCYDFSKQPKAWLLEAYFGPSLAQRELVAAPENTPYLNKRLGSENRDLAFNAGVRASLMLKGNFLLRTGLHYDQITEVFKYYDPNKLILDIHEEYDPVTNQLINRDTVRRYGELYQKTYNRSGMLDIPAMVGFELRKGRSGFNINAGMSVNLYFWKRGAIISPFTDKPAWYTSGKKNALEVFRTNTGISATASVQWFYYMKPRFRVFVEPYFKKVMRPVTVQSHPVEQRYGIAGLRFGLTKILN